MKISLATFLSENIPRGSHVHYTGSRSCTWWLLCSIQHLSEKEGCAYCLFTNKESETSMTGGIFQATQLLVSILDADMQRRILPLPPHSGAVCFSGFIYLLFCTLDSLISFRILRWPCIPEIPETNF